MLSKGVSLRDFNKIAHGMDIILFTIDKEFNIKFCNSDIVLVSGRHPDELVGKKCYNALFGYPSQCRDCPIKDGVVDESKSKFIKNVVAYNGELYSYKTSIKKAGRNLFVASFTDVTDLVNSQKKSEYEYKQARSEKVLLLEEKNKMERHNKFFDTAIDSMQQGMMIVSPNYRIIKINKLLRSFSSKKVVDYSTSKCYEVYGFDEPCKDCPFTNKQVDKSRRKMYDTSMTVEYSMSGIYLVEVLRDTTREIRLIDEIRNYQSTIEEKQRQMLLMNDDLLRMNERLNKAQSVIDEELKQVAHIQHSLLPSEVPNIDGYDFAALYLPADIAGGDYYDYFSVDDKHMGMLVADVSGHGTPAAVIMAITRSIMRLYTKNVISSSKVLAMVNDILCDNIYTNDFVTMYYMLLDFESGVFNYASAGHNPVLLFDESELIVKKITASGMFLGTFENLEYEEKSHRLDIGDILFMYTDGLIEAMNENREQYGYDRLISKLMMFSKYSCSKMMEEIMSDVRSFADDNFEDDITMLIVKKNK